MGPKRGFQCIKMKRTKEREKKIKKTNKHNSSNGNENPFSMQYVEDYNVIVMAY